MKKNKLIKLTFLGFIFSQVTFAQVEGLWTVEKVTVGKETKTPVAKWTQINQDGTFQSGNGWVQNSEGTWKYSNGEFFVQEMNALEDFGAFKVKDLSQEKMIWERLEEGDLVRVIWKKTEKKPKSPADFMIGLWDLTRVENENKDITILFDPENKYYVFMRWDRIYVTRNSEGQKETGYWYINAHRPEFVMISHQTEQALQSWLLSFENEKMIWKGNSEVNRNQIFVFERLNTFPKND